MNWRAKRNARTGTPLFLNYGAFAETRPIKVDCALGTNPAGTLFGDKTTTVVLSNSFKYPSDIDALSDYVCSRWRKTDRKNICWGAGSQGVLTNLGRVFGENTGDVLGFIPQYVLGLMELGVTADNFKPINLTPPDFKTDTDKVISSIDDNTAIVFFDNPNNPTGAFAPLGEVSRLADKCAEVGALLIVDEAYGDFTPDAESSLNLTHENLVTTRSFSKGCGMAGLRIGYAVIRDGELLENYKTAELLFAVSEPSAAIAAKYLPKIDLEKMRRFVKTLKTQIFEFIAGYDDFSVSESHECVPIFTLSCNSCEDLYEKLMEGGIRTEPGRFFGLKDNSVRMRVPMEKQVDIFKNEWRLLFR